MSAPLRPRRRVTVRAAIAPLAAGAVLAVGLLGAYRLNQPTGVSPADAVSPTPTPTTASARAVGPQATVVALPRAVADAQRRTCLAQGGPQGQGGPSLSAEPRARVQSQRIGAPQGSRGAARVTQAPTAGAATAARTAWRTVYAQRLGVLQSGHATRSVLIMESDRAYITCVDGELVGWSLRGPGAKMVPRTPGPSTPAVVTDGVFNGVTTFDAAGGKKLVTFAARVTPAVVAGQVGVSTPDGDGPWMTVPARQGWLVMQIVVQPHSGTRVLFEAVDSAGQPVTLAATDGEPISTLSVPVS